MATSQTSDGQWIACPRCRIANLATSIKCSSCGAVLDPNAPPPKYPSGASPIQWSFIIGISGLLIGSALWAAFNPHGIAAKMYGASLPIFYGVVVLLGFVRSFLRFRRRDWNGGILQCALTILFALAALPAVLDFNH